MDVTIQISKGKEWDHLSYIGPINEDAEVELNSLSDQVGPKCVINFKQVTFVNSCGVRAWINFLRDFEQGREIIFEECTSEIVMQINMIPNFKGKSKIKSVYATYECDECGHNETVLFEQGKNLPKSAKSELPPMKCPQCGSDEMEMEELEEEYFSFLSAS
jgi:anti-anti-sigma regulatory factor